MRTYDFPFPIEIGSVCDLDFMPNGTSVSIQGTESHQVLLWGDERLPLPESWTSPEFPFVRSMPDGRVLVVDTSLQASGKPNAWILSRVSVEAKPMPTSIRIDVHFEIGSSAVEICCLWGMIAVAYHPLSAKAHGHQVQPVQRSGIAFFDLSGRFMMGFNPVCAPLGVFAENIRCMTALSRSQLLFVAERVTVQGEEVENPVVHFDCATSRPRIYSAPFPRAESCTMADGWIHLASPEGWEDQIITFDPETKISQHRGEFLGIFRGLESGAFLSQLSSAEYAVLVPGSPAESAEVESESSVDRLDSSCSSVTVLERSVADRTPEAVDTHLTGNLSSNKKLEVEVKQPAKQPTQLPTIQGDTWLDWQ